MKVSILQEELSKALSLTSRFTSNKVQLPILANVLLTAKKNKLIISATNLEISVAVSIGAKIEDEGSITIPSRVITELVLNLKKGQLSLISEKEHLIINASDFSSTISGINSADFPLIPQEVGMKTFTLPSVDFKESLSSVLYSVSADETRPVLTGILAIMKLGEIVLVSTDGFRLSQKKIKLKSAEINKNAGSEERVIIPKNILSEIVRLQQSDDIEFSLRKNDNQVVFGIPSVVMSSRVINGEFPDFERIIPKDTKIKVNVDKEEFRRAVKLASVFARESANVIKLILSDTNMEIEAENSQMGSQKMKVDAKISGKTDGFTIAFNYRFLEDLLNIIKSDDVQIEFSDPNSPTLFLDTKEEDYLHIIMPVKLQG